MKPNSSISDKLFFNKNDAIHFEGEISFLIRGGKLFAVGFGLDLTKRELQCDLKKKGLPWERAKSFDRSAVFSEFVEFSGDISQLRLELYINDQLAQNGSYKLMLNKPCNILNELENFLTLEDDDILMTGTPKGVGAIQIGDEFVAKIFEKEHILIEESWVVE